MGGRRHDRHAANLPRVSVKRMMSLKLDGDTPVSSFSSQPSPDVLFPKHLFGMNETTPVKNQTCFTVAFLRIFTKHPSVSAPH